MYPKATIYNTYSNMLVGIIHHSNKHIQKHHQRDYVVGPEHCRSNKLCELVFGFNIGHMQLNKTKYGPEQWLQCLKHTVKKQQQHDIIIYFTASKMKVKSTDLRKLQFLTWWMHCSDLGSGYPCMWCLLLYHHNRNTVDWVHLQRRAAPGSKWREIWGCPEAFGQGRSEEGPGGSWLWRVKSVVGS